MLRSLKDLEGYTVSATDGDIGTVENFLLEDKTWTVRYLIAETGTFFEGRRVLVSPISFLETDSSKRHLYVSLTMAKVKGSPGLDIAKPISRQHERDHDAYYGYPYYWGYPGLWGMGIYPGMIEAGLKGTPGQEADDSGDIHMQSARDVRGYKIQGTDDAIGQIDDFIVDDQTWEVRYLVIDTASWWFANQVLVAPKWASRISWEERVVHLGLTRAAIKNSPAWVPSAAVNREYEARLYNYYGHPVYWDSNDRLSEEAPHLPITTRHDGPA